MKGQNFMKITSILMIAGGIIAGIAGVIAILGVSTLVALAGSADLSSSPSPLSLRSSLV